MGVDTNVGPGCGVADSSTSSSSSADDGVVPVPVSATSSQGSLPLALVESATDLLAVESPKRPYEDEDSGPSSSRFAEGKLTLLRLSLSPEADSYRTNSLLSSDPEPSLRSFPPISRNDERETKSAIDSNLFINASENATNTQFASTPTTVPASSARHFRFSGDFTSNFRNGYSTSHSLTAAFVSSSMVNLSDAWDEPTTPDLVNKLLPPSHSPPSSSNSILAELPTRFSFESSSTTSSSHSSSHHSLPQKLSIGPRRLYQRNHPSSFTQHCEGFGVFTPKATTHYGSVEKLSLHQGQEPNKIPEVDVSSLSLSPINRKRELLANLMGPSISL